MSSRDRMTLSQVCEYFRVDLELVRDFADFGLYSIVPFDGEVGIEAMDLDRLKNAIGLHRALGVNKEGIEVILSLRERMSRIREEADALRSEMERLKRHLERDGPEALKSRGLLVEVELLE